MLNRAIVIGGTLSLAAALSIIVAQLGAGPRANVASPSIQIGDLHQQVDTSKLPIQSAPQP